VAAAAGVEVRGEAQLARTMARATAQLDHLPSEPAARIVTAAAQRAAPRRTGRLAASLRAAAGLDGAGTITSPLVYAVPIHWGRPAHNIQADPFIVRAAAATEPEWVRALEPAAQKVCDGVSGA
jgi:hypothetical protein